MVVVLIADLVLPDRESWRTSSITAVGLLGALIPIATLAHTGHERVMFGGAYVVDHYTLALKAFFILAALRHGAAVGRLHQRGRLLQGRVLLPVARRHVRHEHHGRRARPHHVVRRARDDLDPHVRARRVPQARPPVERSGREVLPDRRAVVGAHAVRLLAHLRRHRLDEAVRDLRVHVAARNGPARRGRDLLVARRLRVQGQRGAVPLLGARHLRGRADAGHRVLVGRVEGGRLRRPHQHHLLRLPHRRAAIGRQLVVAGASGCWPRCR